MKPPYANKDWPSRRTRTPRHYSGEPLHLHRVPGTEREFCAFTADVEIYVQAETRQEAKLAAMRKSPASYGTLKWRK